MILLLCKYLCYFIMKYFVQVIEKDYNKSYEFAYKKK